MASASFPWEPTKNGCSGLPRLPQNAANANQNKGHLSYASATEQEVPSKKNHGVGRSRHAANLKHLEPKINRRYQ